MTLAGKVFHGHAWAAAFSRNGFGAVQRCVKRSMGEELELDRVQSAGSALPTLMQLSAIFPNRLEVPINELFYPFIPRPPVLPRAPRAADTAAADADPAPWPDRLRSRRSSSALALPPAASASSSAGPLQLPEVDGLPPPSRRLQARWQQCRRLHGGTGCRGHGGSPAGGVTEAPGSEP